MIGVSSHLAMDSRLTACPECDLVQREPECLEACAVSCRRCGAFLYRAVPHALDSTLALTIAAAIAFAIANILPVLSLDLQGRHIAATLLGMKVLKEGLELTFTDPVNVAEAGNADCWSAQRWNYLYSDKYGSDDYWVSNPKKKGREPLEVVSAKASADGRTVTLGLADWRPAMQILIRARFEGVSLDLYHTVTRVP